MLKNICLYPTLSRIPTSQANEETIKPNQTVVLAYSSLFITLPL